MKRYLTIFLAAIMFFSLTSIVFASEDEERWEKKNDLPVPRSYPHVAVANNTIYLIGGASSGYTATNTVYEYNITTDTWTEKAPMPTKRIGAAIAVVDDLIYVIGGKSSSYSAAVEAYDPKTNTWSSKANLPETKSYTTGVSFNGKI